MYVKWRNFGLILSALLLSLPAMHASDLEDALKQGSDPYLIYSTPEADREEIEGRARLNKIVKQLSKQRDDGAPAT